ncbi:putative membrane-associated kinase regulator 5 [Acorus calamus]|uniref:Membrane-associated kinase regulator 5 n=1 Tax=Acorus calamus TaxID=4465 RepID=A0AAV9C063_ACOCL|nr:putative membrane-associated kinase regulator 5 [Acorus calamus]
METFSLLKYWRAAPSANARSTTTTTTTIASTDDEADADEGPFFDLEFAVPDDEDEEGDEAGGGDDDEGSDDDGTRGFGFTVSSEGGRTDPDPDLSLSPSDDLFFKGSLLDSSSNNNNNNSSNKNHQFPISLAKSATKFRVFMLGLKKPRPPPPPSPSAAAPEVTAAAEKSNPHQNGKFFTVKFKVGEVPVVSLFTRDHSSRSNRGHKHSPPEESADDKRFAKDVMHKYLRMIKPLYVNASKRSAEKPRFSGDKHAKTAAEPAPEVVAKEAAATTAVEVDQNARSLKQVTLPARLRMVGKQLGKSRSASAAVAAAPCPAVVARRRDDSLIEQQDGIRSAIAHCKRSFNASSINGHETGSPLLRCKSESSSSSSSSDDSLGTEHHFRLF